MEPHRARFVLCILGMLLSFQLSSAYALYDGALYCNTTCVDCVAALNNNSYNTVYLNSSLSSPGASCINDPANFSGKTFDCMGNAINGDWVAYSAGIAVSYKTSFTIRNCVISDYEHGIIFSSSANATILNNTVNRPAHGEVGGGISSSHSNNSFVINNSVYNSSDESFEIGNSKNNTFRGNKAYNAVGYYLKENSTDNLFVDNAVYNSGGFVLLFGPSNNLFINNTIVNASCDSNWDLWGCAIALYFAENVDVPPGLVQYGATPVEHSCDNVFQNLTADGKTVYFTNETVTWSDLDAAQIILCNANNSVLDNVTVDGTDGGIYLWYADNVTISNSYSDDNFYGIKMLQSANNAFINLSLQNNQLGDFYLYPESETQCNHLVQNTTGSGGKPIYYSNETVTWSNLDLAGLTICNADNSVLTNITLEGNDGARLYLSDNVTMRASSSNGGVIGFDIWACNGLAFINNTAHDSSYYGLTLAVVNDSLFANNTIYDTAGDYSLGVYAYDVLGSIFTGNNFYNNSGYQFYMEPWLTSSDNNLFYNNIFNASGSQVVLVDVGGGNFWNTTWNCSQTSILGGCMGGNYYSNYTGTDTTGDGIGETAYLAANIIDYLPLTGSRLLQEDEEDEGGHARPQSECMYHSDCGLCEICSAGNCKPEGDCAADSDCGGNGYVCDRCSCAAPECSVDSDCGGNGYTCTNYGCVSPECTRDSDCGGNGYTCSGYSCAAPECISDTECPAGQVCTSYSCVAVLAPECTTDSQCGTDESCSNSACTGITCDCGTIANHTCAAYECCTDYDCADDYSCKNHACITDEVVPPVVPPVTPPVTPDKVPEEPAVVKTPSSANGFLENLPVLASVVGLVVLIMLIVFYLRAKKTDDPPTKNKNSTSPSDSRLR